MELKKLLGQNTTFNRSLNNKAIVLLNTLIFAGSSKSLFKEKKLTLGVDTSLSYNKGDLRTYRYIIVFLADTVSFRFAKMLSYICKKIKRWKYI